MGQKHTLFFSASEGRVNDLRWVLYDKKVSPNLRDHDTQEVALHFAASKGHVQCVKLLLKAGANVDARNNHGLTALHLAVCDGKVECVRSLVDGHADVNATSRFGCTPLHQACYFGRVECCRILLKARAWVDVQESWGRTPLFLAVERRNSTLVAMLLHHGANVHLTDQIHEETALVMASSLLDRKCMHLLLDQGSDPNYQDIFGNTSLHHVVASTNQPNTEICLRLLIVYGAAALRRNNNGETAVDILMSKNMAQAETLLAFTCKPQSLLMLCWVQVRKNTVNKSRTSDSKELYEIPDSVLHFIESDVAFRDAN